MFVNNIQQSKEKDITNTKDEQLSEVVKSRIEDSKYLKYGDIIKIADTCGVTKQAVHGFIKGKNNSSRIEMIFDKFVEDRRKKLDQALENNLK